MKITVYHHGDRSVGIPGDELTIDWPSGQDWVDTKEDRDNFRQALKVFWSDYFDQQANRIGVLFEDECPECGAKMTNADPSRGLVGRCTNPMCISNMPEDSND